MRTFLSFLLLLAGAWVCTDSEIRVVTWNIERFPGQDPDASASEQARHMEVAKRELQKLDPDILLHQEIRDWEAAAELCSVVHGLEVHVTSDFGYPQNLVITSKLPADSAWTARWEPSQDCDDSWHSVSCRLHSLRLNPLHQL